MHFHTLRIFHTPHFPYSALSTLRTFHTPHFPHSSFSILRTFHTPHFPYSSFSTLRIFHTPHFPHSTFSILRIFHTPHSALRTPRFPSNLNSWVFLNRKFRNKRGQAIRTFSCQSTIRAQKTDKQHVPFSSVFTNKIGLVFRITLVRHIRTWYLIFL